MVTGQSSKNLGGFQMNIIKAAVKRYPVAWFCALTVVLSFAAYLLPLPREALPFLIVLVPASVSIALVGIAEGRNGIRTLLGKLAQWRVSLKWVAIALLLGLATRLAMSIAALALGWITAIQLRPLSAPQVGLLAVVLLISAIPEELGWRGFALPRLLKHQSPLAASLIIGVVWGSLHLSLLLPGMMNEGTPALPTVVELAALSVLGAWLFINTRGSLVILTLFHAAQSFFVIVNEGISQAQQTWLMAGVYATFAIAVVVIARRDFLPAAQASKLRLQPQDG
jgi:uncharacterized protein